MTSFSDLHFDDPLLNMATVLVAGIIGGELVSRVRMPKVTGWIATGIVMRQIGLPGMNTVADPGCLDRFLPYMHFVLGFIAFTVGATLYFASLRNTGKRIGLLLVGEATITPILVGGLLYFAGPLLPGGGEMTLEPSVLLAAIAIAGAPGTTVLVIQEARARGILTRTLLAAIGLIDMIAVAAFVFITTLLGDETGWTHGLQSVVVQFGVTFVLGGGCALLAVGLTRTIVSPAFLGPTMVAVILGSWGLAAGFGTSGGILACTFAGIVVTNVRHELVRSAEAYLQTIAGALFALFYTFAGMRLDFGLVPQAAALVALYFVARLIGKCISASVTMRAAGVPENVRGNLGISLLPHGGVAVGLILLVTAPELGFSETVRNLVNTVGLSALAINQLLGPSATRFALQRSGEAQQDRARLFDFLQEQQITTDLAGHTPEEVIRQLAGQLYKTSPMDLDQETFVQRVLAREAESSTCFGQGLMIPHTMLFPAEGQEIRGVLGISPVGLPFETADGKPVHAVLLLATPEAERKRHLQVLSGFANAITRDSSLAEQLYHARSAAHAYDVLHCEEQADINYFLEDAADQAGLRPAT